MNYATAEGTLRWRRAAVTADASHFRAVGDLWLSSIGLGTYLGEPDAETSLKYEQAVRRALELGCNVIDTAINYRFQLSERAVGAALKLARIARDEVFVSTKGGYVPYDGGFPEDPRAYIVETFIQTGIARPEEFAAGGQHCIAPRYLAHQLERSRENLQIETIDLYYVHNPEGQLGEVPREQFTGRLRAAFEFLEEAVVAGFIRGYGMATWNGYRQLPAARDYLSLEAVVALAREVAGDAHHFKTIQLPINLAMPEAIEHKNQSLNGVWVNVLDAAQALGITVFASASLLQARLARNLPAGLRRALGADLSDAQRALQFTRSLPGVTTALVGMSDVGHVEENLRLAAQPVFTEPQLRRALR
ncbi:MAG: aldo/keto reductase [Chloroflexi bacterium]|nr:aldo/keto reductase [Chloroflexota bacterium]